MTGWFWLISKSDVITMRIPFPTVSEELAVRSHMYICINSGYNKEFVKCQTFKPLHNIKNRPPFRFIREEPNINRNPFQRVTTIDCDKAFCVSNITITTDLHTSSRRNVCDDLLQKIEKNINHDSFVKEKLDVSNMLKLNDKMKKSV